MHFGFTVLLWNYVKMQDKGVDVDQICLFTCENLKIPNWATKSMVQIHPAKLRESEKYF